MSKHYLIDGHKVEVVAETPAGIIVQRYFANEYGDHEELYLSNDMEIVDRVFDAPPAAALDERVAALKQEIERLQAAKTDALAEIADVQKSVAEAKAKRDQLDQLSRLDDFIAGKITHYIEVGYGEPKIVEFGSTADERGRMRLLTLFGDSKGNLAWNLNRWRDGSGWDTTVIPATSYEEAVTAAQSSIEDRLVGTADHPQNQWVEIADTWGVAVPQEYRDAAVQSVKANLLETLEKHRQTASEIEAKLEAIQ